MGPDDLDVADTKYNLATLIRGQGNLRKAGALFSECARVYRKHYGGQHDETKDAKAQAEECARG